MADDSRALQHRSHAPVRSVVAVVAQRGLPVLLVRVRAANRVLLLPAGGGWLVSQGNVYGHTAQERQCGEDSE